VGFVPIRKKGKLPGDCIAESYALEYGEATLEIHRNALGPKDNVLVVDDLLATGGTAEASAKLVEKLGAKVAGLAFVVELTFLNGRAKLGDRRVTALVGYDSEA
jgi:adenine phosphoribosyltransferase